MSCSKTQHSDAGKARTPTPQSRVKHSTTEPLCSLRIGEVHMIRDSIVIYRRYETFLILMSLNVFFILKNQYLIKVVLNFKEAL